MAPVAIFAAPAGKDTPANDNPQSLYLYPKNPTSWETVWDGAWGKYNYEFSGTTISGVFNGHGLVTGVKYSLVEYNGWPDVTVIGSDTANKGGNVHINNMADIGLGGENPGEYKVWLVLSGDISDGKFIGWNPASYLFEHNLIYSPSVPFVPPFLD